MIADKALDRAGCAARAAWEANIRAARSIQGRVRIQGWYLPGTNALASPGQQVWWRDTMLGVDGYFVISGVRFGLNEDGTVTDLQLVKDDAFISPIAQTAAQTTSSAAEPLIWYGGAAS